MGTLFAAFLFTEENATAFHEKGVANCSGCHVTHNGEQTGALAGPSVDEGLLIAESPSDVCLLCHAEGLGSVLSADPLAPSPERGPGNFVFLLEDNLNDAPGGVVEPIPGDAAGHNLAAPGHGLTADPRYALSPGGSFPSSRLGCTSCHDPHGNTSFRMLRGVGPLPDGTATFRNPAPVAVGTELDGLPERRRRHTAYLGGASDWCANCHGLYHHAGSGSGFLHPADQALGASVSQRYNEYAGDADPNGGVAATAYLPAVPLEDEVGGTRSTEGARTRSRVMCLSCHRAHASSSPAAGRWDFGVPLLAEDGRESGSYPIPDPYGNPDQGPLCGKCHATSSALPSPTQPPGALGPPKSW